MTRPGHTAMMVGAGWFAAGAILTLLLINLVPGAYYLLAVVVMLAGIIPFGIGLWQFMSFQLKSPESKAHYRASTELRALVRSMVAMAAADGNISKVEIKTISRIYKQLMGHPLKADIIAKVSDTMDGRHYSIHDDLGMTQAEISTQMKEKIIMACYLVMMADGEVPEVEKDRINEIAATLQITPERSIELVEILDQDNSAKQKNT